MATGDPTGDDLCSKSFSASTLTDLIGDYSDTVEVTFDSPVELVSGIEYAIVVRTTGTDADTDPVEWGQHTENAYANGLRCYSTDVGVSWTQYPTRDNYFITKADGVAKDSNSGDVASVLSFYGDNWAAQTFTASSTYTITSVILKLWKDGDTTTGTVTVSIKRVVTAFAPPASGPDLTITKRIVAAANDKIWHEDI